MSTASFYNPGEQGTSTTSRRLQQEERMPRALWKGDISFGLVTVPVGLYSAVHQEKVHFHRVSPDGTCRLRQKLYCPETGKEYDFQEAARGYEIAPDQYVILDDEELDSLKPENGHTINILHFIQLQQI
ncbi:MAG: hypothetical protein J5I62_10995, partial [Flavobacteriales bacterium]|nr:hypothetical protein [Flavobacteriales bacterium]